MAEFWNLAGQRHRPGRDRCDGQEQDPGHVPAQRRVLQRKAPAQQGTAYRVIRGDHGPQSGRSRRPRTRGPRYGCNIVM